MASTGPPATPDPDAEQRRAHERVQSQRQRAEQPADILSSPVALDTDTLPVDESPCANIQRLELHTVGTPDASDLPWALRAAAGPHGDDSPVGKCLGTEGIARILQRVQQALIQRGLVTTRVLTGAQDVSQGTLTLTLVPGRVHAVRLADPAAPPVNVATAIPVRSSDLVNLRHIEQGLENLQRVPTAQVDIQIEPAQAPDTAGLSDLVVTYQQATAARLSITADDSGSHNTGVYQGSATVSLDNPLRLSDLFYVTASRDLGGGDDGPRGTRGKTVHYSVPFGYWTWGATHSNNQYFQSTAGRNQTYVYHGTSDNTEIKLSRLVYRDALRKTSVSVKAWQRKSSNFIDDTEVQVQRRSVGGWELGVRHQDHAGQATVEGSFAYKRGMPGFDSIAAPEEPFGEGTSKFGLLTLDLESSVPFVVRAHRLTYRAALHAQENLTPLTPQDRMAIGGRATVRGFDGESTLVGERGWTLRNDLGLALGASGQEIYAGIDAGEVSTPHRDTPLGQTLSGGVLGLRGAFKRGAVHLHYDLFVGAPLHHPAHIKTAQTTAGFTLTMRL